LSYYFWFVGYFGLPVVIVLASKFAIEKSILIVVFLEQTGRPKREDMVT